jgi:hypothetical protein
MARFRLPTGTVDQHIFEIGVKTESGPPCRGLAGAKTAPEENLQLGLQHGLQLGGPKETGWVYTESDSGVQNRNPGQQHLQFDSGKALAVTGPIEEIYLDARTIDAGEDRPDRA